MQTHNFAPRTWSQATFMSQGNQKDHHTDICPCFCSLWCGQAVHSQHSQMVCVYVSVCLCVGARVLVRKKIWEHVQTVRGHFDTWLYIGAPRDLLCNPEEEQEEEEGRSRTQFVVQHLYDLHKTTICLLILLTLQCSPIGQTFAFWNLAHPSCDAPRWSQCSGTSLLRSK